MTGSRLDRANRGKVNFGTAAPGVNTRGNIYLDTTTSTLYVKSGSTWYVCGDKLWTLNGAAIENRDTRSVSLTAAFLVNSIEIVGADGEVNKAAVEDSSNWDTAYSHSQDNTQAHSDYLLNNASDETSGTLTAAGFVASANSATLTHSGTTSLTIASTAGTVIVEGVTFNGAAISGATNTNWDAAYSHVSSNGSDHSYIDQSVVSGATPTFSADNFSDGGGNAIITTTQETNFEAAYSHVSDNTQAHSDYLLNNASDTTSGTITMAGAIISDNTATITHSGTTSLTIASTAGTVAVEGIIFTATELSSATGIELTPATDNDITLTISDTPESADNFINLNGEVKYGSSANGPSISAYQSSLGLRLLQRYDMESGDFLTIDSDTNAELTDTDAEQAFVYINAEIAQSGTAGYTVLKVNADETSIGTGTNNIFDLQVDDVSKFSISNEGIHGISAGGRVTNYSAPTSLADDASFDLPDASAGYGSFSVGDGVAFGMVQWKTTGEVTIIYSAGDVSDGDDDGYFCFFDNGTAVRVRNRLGTTQTVMFDYHYTTSP